MPRFAPQKPSRREEESAAVANKKDTNHSGFPSSKGTNCPVLPLFTDFFFEHILAKKGAEIANRCKTWQIVFVKSSKNVVKLGKFYYRHFLSPQNRALYYQPISSIYIYEFQVSLNMMSSFLRISYQVPLH